MTQKIYSGKAVKTEKEQNNAAMSTRSIACAVRPKLRSLEKGVGGGLYRNRYLHRGVALRI